MVTSDEIKLSRNNLILLSSVAWGLMAHGYMFFNKFSFHDDVKLPFHIGATVTSGRWFLGALKWFTENFVGGLFSLPVFNGMLSVFFVALSACLVAELLGIRKRISCICLAGIMVTFPAFTSTLGYMFTSPFYMIGLLMAVVGAYLICVGHFLGSLLLGCIMCACSIGTYQAGLPMVLSLMLMYSLRKIIVEREQFQFWKEGIRLSLATVFSLLIYVGVNHFCLGALGQKLSDYETISTYGFGGWGEYINRLRTAYKEFFVTPRGKMRNMFPQRPLEVLHIAVVALGLSLAVARSAQLGIKKLCGVKFMFMIALFPLVSCFSYIMVDSKLTHSLMMYARVSVFILFIILLETSYYDMLIPRWLFRLGTIMLLCVVIFYCRFANICYFKAEFQQSQAISYFTRLVSHIESTKGYRPEYPVAFLNEKNKQGFSAPQIPEFDDIHLLPYYFTDQNLMINNYAWKSFMRMWCGYAPIVIENIERFEKLPEVLAMPRYPSEGSIIVIDNTVIVKF